MLENKYSQMMKEEIIDCGFLVSNIGNVTIFVKEKFRDALIKRVKDIAEGFEADNVDGHTLKGRGRCLTLTLDEIDERVVVRRYRHGGLFGKLTGELFCNQHRPLNEALLCEKAVKGGLRTVEVVAVIKRNRLYPFFKAEIVTKEIEGAFDLIHAVDRLLDFESKLCCKKGEIINEVAFMVKKLHDIGIYHADLHLKNILLKEDEKGFFSSYIIDLDKSVLLDSMDIEKRMKNLYRLDRSVVKLKMACKGRGLLDRKVFPVSKADRVRFFREYIKDSCCNNEEWRTILKMGDPNYSSHKICWTLLSCIKNAKKFLQCLLFFLISGMQ